MEEKVKKIANSKALKEYLQTSEDFRDEDSIAELVEQYANAVYEDPHEVGMRIVKEMFLRSETLDEETFANFFCYFEEEAVLRKYEVGHVKPGPAKDTILMLLNSIYKDAVQDTVYLSNYAAWQIEEVRNDFLRYVREDRSLAMVFYQRLNRIAMKKNGSEEYEHCLPFHCYAEPNGDVVFTKNKRGPECYDAEGKPLYSEVQLTAGAEPPKMAVLHVAFLLLIILFIVFLVIQANS